MVKFIDVFDRPKEADDPFALYVSEQSKNLGKRRILLEEKRINYILSELRFEEFEAPDGRMHFNQHFTHSQPIHSIVCSCHVTYAFQSESTLYSCLNVKELLARSRREI